MGYPEHIQYSIDLLRRAERLALKMQPERGFWLAFSGGKDSQCIYHLAKLAGVKFEAHYAVTTLDHPELVYFIRRNYKDVIWDHPKRTFLQLCIYKKMLPTMTARFCCQELKESAGAGHCTIIGVRKAESSRRAKRKELEKAHGPIPKGCYIQFRNGNSQDIRLENLYIISHADQMRKENSIHARYPEELKQIIMLKGSIKRKITELKKKDNHGKEC